MSQETIVVQEGTFKGMNALEYVIWQDEGDEWYGCGTGYGENNLWEGDDVGPFDSRQEVVDWLDDLYEVEAS